MTLKLKFIFIMDGFIRNRVCRSIALPPAVALAFIVGAASPVVQAQSQVSAVSNQTANPSAADVNDPPGPASDSGGDTEAMFPHFKSTRFWLSGQANFIF